MVGHGPCCVDKSQQKDGVGFPTFVCRTSDFSFQSRNSFSVAFFSIFVWCLSIECLPRKRSVEDGGMKGEIKEDDSLKIEPNDGGETEITFLAIKQHENPENSTKLGSKLVSARYNPVTFRESSKKSSKTHYTEYYSNNTQRNPVQLSKTTKNR